MDTNGHIILNEDYVSFEVAKLLKEKGFKESTQFVWYEHLPSPNAVNNSEIGKPKRDYFYWEKEGERDSPWTNNSPVPSYINGEVYSAPTHQMAMKWLREKYDLHIIAYPYKANDKKKWCCQVYKTFNLLGHEKYVDETLDSYEEAVEAALKYCLEHLI